MEDIGIRLKKVRLAKGFSQRQLAKSSGVSNAMICLIERGKSNPSLGLLKNILDAISMSVSQFFSLELEDKPEKVFFEKEGKDDSFIWTLIAVVSFILALLVGWLVYRSGEKKEKKEVDPIF